LSFPAFRGLRMKLKVWQISYIIGFVLVLLIESISLFIEGVAIHVAELFAGIMLIAGACEAFVLSVEGISHNMHMTDYVSGIYASLASTIPELAVLSFLILNGNYEMAWVLALATIFVNSLVFAVYTLMLPKDETGNFQLPDAIMWVGSDLLAMAAIISLAVGLAMLLLHIFLGPVYEIDGFVLHFTSDELLLFGICLVGVFIAYLYWITKYYGRCDPNVDDGDMACSVHEPVTKRAMAALLVVAAVGAFFGGEALSSFAEFASGDIAHGGLGLNFIQAALLLVVFGGTPEYIIVASSHRKDQIEIALSNAFGGIVQVFFVVFGYTLLFMGLVGAWIPIDLFSVVLVFFAFPSLSILRTMITDDQKINALESISMIAVFAMMLYLLLVFGIY
jgi:Ca2+/Na+ antiporter